MRKIAVIACFCGVGYAQLTYPRIDTLSGGYTGDGGQAAIASLNGAGDIAIDALQNVYVADINNHRIRRISPTGLITTVAGTGESGFLGDNGPATSAKLNFPRGVAVDRNTNIYIADTGNNRIRRVDHLSGTITTVLGTGDGSSLGDDGPAVQASTNVPTHVAVDVYVTGAIYFSEPANNRVRRIDAINGLVTRYAGLSVGYSGDSGQAKNAQLNTPEGLACDSAGNLYIADRKNNRVRVVDKNFTTIGSASSGIALNEPVGVAVDTTGAAIYVADSGSSRVLRLAGGSAIVAGSNGRSGFSGDAGPGNLALLNAPVALAWRSGQVYLNDSGNQRIRALNLASGFITTVAGSFVTPTGAGKRLAFPGGVVLDSTGIAYVVEPTNHRVIRVDTAGNTSLFAGTGTAGFSGEGGPATQAQLNSPAGIALDTKGRICIADRGNQRIRCVDSTQKITTIAGTGTVGSDGEGQPATKATLNNPRAIAFAKNGTLYIGDTGNHTLRTVDPQGNMHTLQYIAADIDSVAVDGLQNVILADSSTGIVRRINNSTGDINTVPTPSGSIPLGLAGDQNGALFISDAKSHVIRKIDNNGSQSIVTGSGVAGYGGDGGAPTLAIWNTPSGIALDAKGNIVAVDSQNQRLRRIVFTSEVVVPPTGTIALTLASVPTAQVLLVDGAPITTPVTLSWFPNSEHTVSAPTPAAGQMTRNFYDYWSDGLSQSHTVISPLGPKTITAFFRTQHLLTLVKSEGGEIGPTPSSTDGFYDQGTQISLLAQAQATYSFRNFNGDLSGRTNPQTITLTQPTSVGAVFLPGNAPVLTPDSPSVGVQFQSGATPTVLQRTFNLSSSVPVDFTADSNVQWLRVQGSGTTPATIQISLDLTNFAPGQYTGSIFFRSGAVLNDLEVPVNVTVLPRPILSVTVNGQPQPPSFDLSVEQGSQTTLPLMVTSTQPANVVINALVPPGFPSWLRVSPTNGLAPLSSILTVSAAVLAVGSYSGTVNITALYGNTISIPVNLTVVPQVVKSHLVTDASTGLQFQMIQGGVAPPAQVINITASAASLTFSIESSVTTDRNFIQLDRRSGATPAQIQVSVLPTVLTTPGTYLGHLTITAAQDNQILIPIVFNILKAEAPSLKIDTTMMRFNTSANSDVQRASLMIQNPSQNVLSFSVNGSTQDGNGWLNATPSAGGTFADRPALVEVAVDPHNLPVGTYMGQLVVSPASDSGLQSQMIPVVFSVSGTGRKLVAADTSIFVRAIRGQPGLPPVPLDMVTAGNVTFTATANKPWIKLTGPNGSSGTSIAGSFGPGLSSLTMDVDLAPLSVGDNFAQIVIDSNSDNGRITIPVDVQLLSTGASYVRVAPVGMAFVTTGNQSRTAAFVASRNGNPVVSTNASWLSASASSGFLSNVSTIQVSVRAAGLTPGQEQRGTVTIQDPAGLSSTLSVLLYVPTAGGASGNQANANCSPTRFIPLFTSLQSGVDQPVGSGATTEVVIIDDCGNMVDNGLTGGALSNRDPQLNLVALGGGRWKTTWTPRSQGATGFVSINVVSGDPRLGIEASKPANVNANIFGALGVPLLTPDPIQTPDGLSAPFLTPGGQFIINGTGFVSGTDKLNVTLGDENVTILKVTATSIMIQVPDDAPVNTQRLLVVTRGDTASAPETVLIAPAPMMSSFREMIRKGASAAGKQ